MLTLPVQVNLNASGGATNGGENRSGKLNGIYAPWRPCFGRREYADDLSSCGLKCGVALGGDFL